MDTPKSFPAKLMLFGEYTVIHNSQALALPYHAYSGSLVSDNQPSKDHAKSNESLKGLCAYLKNDRSKFDWMDIRQLETDLEAGLHFKSTIPQGYGTGSSGAVVAAIFDRYSIDENRDDLLALRKQLSQIESYFHGSSSGLDPLVSLKNQPVLMKDNKNFELVKLPDWTDEPLCIFLIDSGFPRHTSPLVQRYLLKFKETEFSNGIRKELIPANNLAIAAFLAKDQNQLRKSVKSISAFQFRNFKPMIGTMLPEWSKGLETEDYILKLCGAGGGGFVLGFSNSVANIRKHFREYQMVSSTSKTPPKIPG